jgi:hypothetical protein
MSPQFRCDVSGGSRIAYEQFKTMLSKNIPKILALSVFAALSFLVLHSRAADFPAALKKYFQPVSVTKLDWLLLQAEVEDFTGVSRWDEHHLVDSVVLYSIPRRGLVGMTFAVKKESYIDLSDDTARKVFADVVVEACDVLKAKIPEIEQGANVYANFVLLSGRGVIVAEYSNGKVSLIK